MTTAISIREVMDSCYNGVTYTILSIIIVALIKKKSQASHYTSHYKKYEHGQALE